MEEELRSLGLPLQFGKKQKKTIQSRRERKHQFNEAANKTEGETNLENQESTELQEENQEKIFSVPITIDRQLLKQIGPQPINIPESIYPVIQEFQIVGHTKPITAIALDGSGNKVFTGAPDCCIKYWNFASMKASDPAPETSIELETANEVNSLDVSTNAQLILLATGNPEAKLFDGKGLKKGETKRGDMYLYDAKYTTGHVAAITCAQFRPKDSSFFATCSVDGTFRYWDTQSLSKHLAIFKLTQKGGVRNRAHSLAWSTDGNGAYVCASDNCIRYFSFNSGENQASMLIKTSNPMTAVTVANDGYSLSTKSGKNVFLWDIRNSAAPIWNISVESDVSYLTFSPDSKHILIPKSVHNKSKYGGCVYIAGAESGELETEIKLPSGVGARICKWHPQTNEIIIGSTDGIARVLFDPRTSRAGALLTLEKGLIIKTETDEAVIGQLIPRLVDPENERVIRGFWFPFAGDEKSRKRAAAEPKAPQWGEGHHGQLAIHPVQAELHELGQVDIPDDTDIVDALISRNKLAEHKYFTNVTENREVD